MRFLDEPPGMHIVERPRMLETPTIVAGSRWLGVPSVDEIGLYLSWCSPALSVLGFTEARRSACLSELLQLSRVAITS